MSGSPLCGSKARVCFVIYFPILISDHNISTSKEFSECEDKPVKCFAPNKHITIELLSRDEKADVVLDPVPSISSALKTSFMSAPERGWSSNSVCTSRRPKNDVKIGLEVILNALLGVFVFDKVGRHELPGSLGDTKLRIKYES
jgi:hypothetical protein